jgi:DNA-binding MarR family transcriptional regulator
LTALAIGLEAVPVGNLFSRLRVVCGRHGLTLSQLSCLSVLHEEPLNMTEISKVMDHSTAASTGLVDRLEEMGLIERKHAKGDRRCIYVHLTDKGRGVLEDVAAEIKQERAPCYVV